MVTIRYYASGQTTSGGWGFYSSAAGIYGLEINGSVVSVQLIAPAMGTATVTSVTTSTASLGGRITGNGGSAILQRGTVWKLSSPVTISDNMLAEGGTDTGVFVHQRSDLPPATKIYFSAFATNATGTTLATESSFFTLAQEPLAHVTNFTAAAGGTTSVNLTWTPAVTSTGGYLILQKTGSTPSTALPQDGVQYLPGTTTGDAVVAANVTDGSCGAQTILNLSPATMYTFTIFPFHWDGSNNATTNYLTGAVIPGAVATTATPQEATYYWTGSVGSNFTVAGNWSPERTFPATSDILVFNSGTAVAVTSVPTQSIGQLRVTSNTAVSMSGNGTLTILGDSGVELTVTSGCQLNISGANVLSLSLPATATGQIAGSMTFSGGAHRLLAADAGAIVFQPGGSFKAGGSFTGNPFGTTSLNSVVFSSGSAYLCTAGGNPFGAVAPASVVVFQPGSLYRADAYVVPSFGGRTYGNFEMNYAGIITVTGSSAVTIDNFTASQGTFYFNLTGNPGHAIKGNIFVSSLATLIFNPSSAGTLHLNGTTAQTFTGSGSCTAMANSTIVVDNTAGVTLSMDVTLNNLTISNDAVFTIAPNAALTVSGNLVNGGAATGFNIEPEGSLIHNSANVQATVKRNFGAASWSDWHDGWHFISSPVSAQGINAQGGFLTSGSGNDFDLYTWSEPDNAWVNFKNSVTAPTFLSVNGSANFQQGAAYLAAYQQEGTKKFQGVLRVADLAVSNLTITPGYPDPGWHLLGNPFLCSLTWFTDWNAVNIGGVAMIWNEASMSYKPVNAGETIPPLNGFMVQVTGTSGTTGSLVMPASRRIHGDQPWYKSVVQPVISLFVREPGNSAYQESQIRVNPMSTNDFDPLYDGKFLKGYAPQFYSKAGDQQLIVNSLPELNERVTVPFCFIKTAGDRYQLEARISGEIKASVLLYDLVAKTSQNLSLEPVYPFSASLNDPPQRFLITFSKTGEAGPPAEDCTIFSSGDDLCVNAPSEGSLDVNSLSGKQVMHEAITGKGAYRTKTNLAAGYYVVRLTTESSTIVKKVFINSQQ